MAEDTYDIAVGIVGDIADEERNGSDFIRDKVGLDKIAYDRELETLWRSQFLDGIDVSGMSTKGHSVTESAS